MTPTESTSTTDAFDTQNESGAGITRAVVVFSLAALTAVNP